MEYIVYMNVKYTHWKLNKVDIFCVSSVMRLSMIALEFDTADRTAIKSAGSWRLRNRIQWLNAAQALFQDFEFGTLL